LESLLLGLFVLLLGRLLRLLRLLQRLLERVLLLLQLRPVVVVGEHGDIARSRARAEKLLRHLGTRKADGDEGYTRHGVTRAVTGRDDCDDTCTASRSGISSAVIVEPPTGLSTQVRSQGAVDRAIAA
jgi:hypothetical protein